MIAVIIGVLLITALCCVEVFLLLLGWASRCHGRALRQREALMVLLSEYPFQATYWSSVARKVSYTDHVESLLTLSDPWLLYPEEVRDLARGVCK